MVMQTEGRSIRDCDGTEIPSFRMKDFTMTPWQNRATDLTRRMADDMKVRNYSQRTIDAYTYHLGRFAEFLGRSPLEATAEDVRSFQLHMIEVRKIQWSTFNQAVSGLRFFFKTTAPSPWHVDMIPFGKRPKKLPAVLSGEEVNRLLSCVKCHKHRTFLLVQYAAGMRLSEAAHLKISDIDSQRMQLRIGCGKGQKTRIVPMSPRLLHELREYWKVYQPPVYLFPGRTSDVPLQPTTIQKMFKVAAKEAGILKDVTPHTLRHSYATGLLEAGVDLLAISRLLGHASFSTTMKYLHVRTLHLGSTPSPIDWLPIRQLPGWMQPPGSKNS
jgi:site-specific recombinase XerD